MSRTRKEPLTRLAYRIAESAAHHRSKHLAEAVRASGRTLTDHWDTVQRQQERAAKAIDRGWLLAARRVLSDGRFDREAWSPVWETYCQAVDRLLSDRHAGLSSSELHTELQDLSEEFEHLGWDRRWLWVTIESIVLEEVYLGRFQIKLRLDRIGSPNADDDFDVVALDPNPAGGDSEVTHPHVSGGRLCQGEATGPIRLALEQGRLMDFFQLVHSVLRTYNPESPFVRLDAWDGVRCSECGANVSQEETSYCEACGDDYCHECSSYCRNCDQTHCVACLVECRGCGESFCGGCLSACEGCGTKGLCGSCLDSCQQCGREGLCDACRAACAECKREGLCADCLEHDLCTSCRGVQAEENDDANDNEGTDKRETTRAETGPALEIPAGRAIAADTAVHADGLAQAPVPVPCG